MRNYFKRLQNSGQFHNPHFPPLKVGFTRERVSYLSLQDSQKMCLILLNTISTKKSVLFWSVGYRVQVAITGWRGHFPLSLLSCTIFFSPVFCFIQVLNSFNFCQRRQWHHTPVLWPGKSHGWRSLVGYSPWGLEELDTTD